MLWRREVYYFVDKFLLIAEVETFDPYNKVRITRLLDFTLSFK